MTRAAPGTQRFRDRAHAGRLLAERLRDYAGRDDVVVLALPRGGVPVGYEVARALDAPLDVFLVRKLGVPGHEEHALGAIATGGIRVLNTPVVESLNLPAEWVEAIDAKERRELSAASRLTAGTGLRPTSQVARSSSSTTGWRPERRCWRRCTPSGPTSRRASWPPRRSRTPPCASTCARLPTTSCACSRRAS